MTAMMMNPAKAREVRLYLIQAMLMINGPRPVTDDIRSALNRVTRAQNLLQEMVEESTVSDQ